MSSWLFWLIPWQDCWISSVANALFPFTQIQVSLCYPKLPFLPKHDASPAFPSLRRILRVFDQGAVLDLLFCCYSWNLWHDSANVLCKHEWLLDCSHIHRVNDDEMCIYLFLFVCLCVACIDKVRRHDRMLFSASKRWTNWWDAHCRRRRSRFFFILDLERERERKKERRAKKKEEASFSSDHSNDVMGWKERRDERRGSCYSLTLYTAYTERESKYCSYLHTHTFRWLLSTTSSSIRRSSELDLEKIPILFVAHFQSSSKILLWTL